MPLPPPIQHPITRARPRPRPRVPYPHQSLEHRLLSSSLLARPHHHHSNVAPQPQPQPQPQSQFLPLASTLILPPTPIPPYHPQTPPQAGPSTSHQSRDHAIINPSRTATESGATTSQDRTSSRDAAKTARARILALAIEEWRTFSNFDPDVELTHGRGRGGSAGRIPIQLDDDDDDEGDDDEGDDGEEEDDDPAGTPLLTLSPVHSPVDDLPSVSQIRSRNAGRGSHILEIETPGLSSLSSLSTSSHEHPQNHLGDGRVVRVHRDERRLGRAVLKMRVAEDVQARGESGGQGSGGLTGSRLGVDDGLDGVAGRVGGRGIPADAEVISIHSSNDDGEGRAEEEMFEMGERVGAEFEAGEGDVISVLSSRSEERRRAGGIMVGVRGKGKGKEKGKGIEKEGQRDIEGDVPMTTPPKATTQPQPVPRPRPSTRYPQRHSGSDRDSDTSLPSLMWLANPTLAVHQSLAAGKSPIMPSSMQEIQARHRIRVRLEAAGIRDWRRVLDGQEGG